MGFCPGHGVLDRYTGSLPPALAGAWCPARLVTHPSVLDPAGPAAESAAEVAGALARDAGFKNAQHVSGTSLAQCYLSGRTDGLRPSSGEDFLVARTTVIAIHPDVQHQGFDREVMDVLLTDALERLKHGAVAAAVDAPNAPSVRLVEALGFTLLSVVPAPVHQLRTYTLVSEAYRTRAAHSSPDTVG
jgi:GNAT superfamily N-acetyltransferase